MSAHSVQPFGRPEGTYIRMSCLSYRFRYLTTFFNIQVSNDILKLPNGQLEAEKPFKLFDMKKFQQNVNRELKRQYPERYKLETQVG